MQYTIIFDYNKTSIIVISISYRMKIDYVDANIIFLEIISLLFIFSLHTELTNEVDNANY